MSNIQRHNVSIPVVLDGTGQFTSYLSCPFVPDEIKCKNLTFQTVAGNTPGVFTVQMNGLGVTSSSPGGSVLGALIDPCTTFSGITIPITNWNNGTYTFGVYEDTIPSVALTGASLNILLEFRRYRIRN